MLTDDGRRLAVFCTRLAGGVIAPLFAGDEPNAPPHCAARWPPSAAATTDYLTTAGLAAAA